MNINKEIEKYVVHLKFRDNNGSGVLFKPYEISEYCYLFTAKHNFEEEDEYGNKEFFSPFIYHNDFEILTSNFSQLKIESIVDIKDELRDIDLLILSIKNYNYSCWEKIKSIKIFSGDLKKDMNCVIGGFPAILKHNELEFYNSNFVIENSDYTLEVESKRILSTHEINELETNRGISGGGLFIQGNDNKIYLLGIEIEFKPRHNLKCINLQKIIDIINNKISYNLEKIMIGGHPTLDEYFLADKKFDLSLIKTNLENDYIKDVKNKSIEFLKDNSKKVNKDLHDRYSKVLLEMKDLANSYLYRGAVFNGQYNQLATNNLKKAIQLNEELEIYLAQAKYVRTKDNEKRIDDKLKRDKKLQIDILKGKILETDNLEELKKLYIDLLFYLNKYQDFYKKDIAIYQRKLIDEVYIKQQDFTEAERILEDSDLNKFLDRKYIRDRLFKIYLDKAYPQNTKLSKKEFADKLFTLLGMFDFESNQYLIIRRRIEDLNVFDNFIISLNENLIKSEREFDIYKKKINQLTKQVIFLSKYVSEEKLLHEINFKIFNSHKKLDNIEKLQNSSINTTVEGIKTIFHKKNKDNNKNIFILFLIFFILGLLALDNQAIIKLLNHYYNIFLNFIQNN